MSLNENLSYQEFCKKFGLSSNNQFSGKNKEDVYSFIATSNSIEEAIENPPHMALVYQFFPDVTVSELFKLSSKLRELSNTWKYNEVHDFYDTHYFEFIFEISVINLYQFYCMHSGFIANFIENFSHKTPLNTYGIVIKHQYGHTYYYAQNKANFESGKLTKDDRIIKFMKDELITPSPSRNTLEMNNRAFKFRFDE